jgi:hypothetical protein
MPRTSGPIGNPSAPAFSSVNAIVAESRFKQVCCPLQPTVRSRSAAQIRQQRSVGVHLTVHLEIRFALPDQRKRGAHFAGADAVAGAERRVRSAPPWTNAGELLEQNRLALHHRLTGKSPDIAEAEHGGSVRYDSDKIAASSIVARGARVVLDLRARDATPGE